MQTVTSALKQQGQLCSSSDYHQRLLPSKNEKKYLSSEPKEPIGKKEHNNKITHSLLSKGCDELPSPNDNVLTHVVVEIHSHQKNLARPEGVGRNNDESAKTQPWRSAHSPPSLSFGCDCNATKENICMQGAIKHTKNERGLINNKMNICKCISAKSMLENGYLKMDF